MWSSILSCILLVTFLSTTHALTIRDLSRTLSHEQIATDSQHDVTMGINPFATPFYMHIKTHLHPNVQGGVTEKGKEGSIAVYDVDHTVQTSVSQSQGSALGHRQHQPLKVRIDIDKAAPILYSMWASNENVQEVQIDQWSVPSALGSLAKASKILFQIKLLNGNVVNIHNMGSQLEVSFSYTKIEWTWVEGGITGQDDWNTAV